MRYCGVLLLATVTIPSFAQNGQPRGIYVGDLDRTASACTDFFEYSNGTWRKQNPIPSYMDRWSRRWKAGEDAKDQLKTILDDVSSRTDWKRGTVGQLVGDYYGACMALTMRGRNSPPMESLKTGGRPTTRGASKHAPCAWPTSSTITSSSLAFTTTASWYWARVSETLRGRKSPTWRSRKPSSSIPHSRSMALRPISSSLSPGASSGAMKFDLRPRGRWCKATHTQSQSIA